MTNDEAEKRLKNYVNHCFQSNLIYQKMSQEEKLALSQAACNQPGLWEDNFESLQSLIQIQMNENRVAL